MVDLPNKDEAIYMIVSEILQNEPNAGLAEFLCIALLTGFQKVEDLTNIVEQSNDPTATVEAIKQATSLMSYDKTKPQNY